MKTAWQIFAIARTEFRFGLRRGAPVVVTTLIGIIVGAAILLNPFANLDIQASDMKTMSAEVSARWAAAGVDINQLYRDEFADMLAVGAVMGWNVIYLALLFLPVAAVIAIPADRIFGVLELLKSTPINVPKYLAGKILGILGLVFLVSSITLMIFFITIEIVLVSVLHFNITLSTILFYTKLSGMDGLPVLLWGTVGGVLVGAFFRTRRAALLPGFLFGVLSLVFWVFAFKAPAAGFQYLDVASYFVLRNYASATNAIFLKIGREGFMPALLGEGAPALGIGSVLAMYAAIILILLIFTALTYLWLQHKENF